MAATIENLREILKNVNSPVQLIDRKTEMVFLSKECLAILKQPTQENAKKFMEMFLVEMVRYFVTEQSQFDFC